VAVPSGPDGLLPPYSRGHKALARQGPYIVNVDCRPGMAASGQAPILLYHGKIPFPFDAIVLEFAMLTCAGESGWLAAPRLGRCVATHGKSGNKNRPNMAKASASSKSNRTEGLRTASGGLWDAAPW
jgi:hypothetical protein